ncbi:conserved hypothetical protein [Trichophyton verrucosum HKI 0517]|uniref:Uncharacterized protein n=1 Tax=Trichophyton verrucosum (strain HKI 0517) TaxID=663202 RepID=D4DIJ8_TRIVH|nr:uncharacterized protein TRV_07008 [Trichophyton verrucosum HKI 0517]EFE38350.1 conserved hypothetical protein [Trichophyton verrucosum HKI 0517]
MARPDAPGYIAPNNPHAINQITVGDLGSDEILLLATDSGNVAAYRVERIFWCIENRRAEDTDPVQVGNGVECFFSEWVTQSAWALAIHKFARMIAVSSNTTTITIFAFALVDNTEVSHVTREGSSSRAKHPKVHNNDWIHITSISEFLKLRSWSRQRRRSQNIRLSLSGHSANIPNVSFLNCDLDPHGDWLVSTDINNKLLVWRIWERFRPVNYWDFYSADDDQQYDDLFDDRQRGWNVLAVDPRSFRMKKDLLEACGGPPHKYPDKDAPYDLSFLASKVHDATQYYNVFSSSTPLTQRRNQGPPPDELFPLTHSDDSDGGVEDRINRHDTVPGIKTPPVRTETPSDIPLTVGAQGTLQNNNSPLATHNYSNILADAISNTPVLNESDEDSDETYNEDEDEEDEEGAEDEEDEGITPAPGTNTSHATVSDADIDMDHDNSGDNPSDEDSSETSNLDELDELSDTPMNEDIHSGSNTATKANGKAGLLRDERPTSDLFHSFQILHFSESHIRMLPGPFSTGPSVIFRAALSQVVTNPVQFIEATDRFNMALQIPELGVVVAASQKGRVAILGLTEVRNKGKVFRMDRILPLASQERKRLRPLCPLLGIAASPVVPHLIPPESPSDDYEDTSTGMNDVDVQEIRNASLHPIGPKAGLSGKFPSHLPFGGTKKEKWHGIEYSRRYRLFLTYCDHTILHYELYYDWPKELRGPEAQMAYDKNEPFILRP